jgi:WD40 repeat protein
VTVAAAPAVRDSGVVDRDNPWPGLAAFRERDHEFFYGREAAVEVLIDLVTRERMSVLYGASGLGKTSLIQAGLFPRARTRDLLPVRIRLDYTRAEALHEQVFAALLKDATEHRVEAPARGQETMWEFFYRKDSLWWSDRHRLLTPLLVFDQFEETFTVGRRSPEAVAATRAFLLDLRGLALGFPPDEVKARTDANPDEALRYSLARSPVHVLFSFREDYLAEFAELREVFPGIAGNDFRLLPMSTADGLRVILSPGGHLVSEDVAKEIVGIIAAQRPTRRKLASELPVDPTLLSVFCRELNNERRALKEARITGELLEDRQVTILDNFYTRSLDGLDPGVQTFIEDELVLPDSPERNFVAEEVALRKPGVTPAALETLIDRRLLRRDERDGPARIELTHDVLIDPVRRSRDARRAREQELQRVAAAREEAERARQAAERAFERQRRQRLWVFVSVLSVLLVAAVILAAWALRQSREATRQKAQRTRVARTLTEALIQTVDSNHPEKALAYIAFAARTDPDDPRMRARLIDSLLHASWPLPRAAMKQAAGGVRWAEFDPTGSYVLTVSDKDAVSLWPATGGPSSRALAADASFGRFAPNGDALVVTKSGAVELWDPASGRRVARFAVPEATITAAAVSPDAQRLAVGDAQGRLHVWRLSAPDQPLLTRSVYPEAIAIVQFSDDSRRLLTTGGGRASVWEIPSFTAVTIATQLATFLAADFAPDNDHLVLTDDAGKGRLWQLGRGGSGRRGQRGGTAGLAPYAEFQPNGRLFFTQFSPDGLLVVTASEDGTAKIWNTVAGDPIGMPMRHGAAVVTAVFSRDGSRILTASRDGSAQIWDTGGVRIAEPMWHPHPLESATFSRDGDRVVTASDDGTAQVWDVRPGAAVPESWSGSTSVSSAQFSPDSRYVLLTNTDKYNPSDTFASVWDRSEGRTSVRTSYDAIAPPQFLPGGDTILVVRRNTAMILRAADGAAVGAPMPGAASILIARASADGSRIAVLRADGSTQIYDANGAPITRLQTPVGDAEKQPPSLDLSRDGRFVAIPAAAVPVDAAAPQENQSRPGRVGIWDLSRPDVPPRQFSTPWPIASAAFSPDAKWLLATGAGDAAYVFPIDRAPDRGAPSSRDAVRTPAPDAIPLHHDRRVISGRFNADGTAIITTSEDATARLWRAPWANPEVVLRLDAPGGTATVATTAVRSGAFNRNGDLVVTAAEDGTARVWNAQTGEQWVSFPHPAVVTSAEFGADGHVLTVCADGRARIWDLPIGVENDVTHLVELAEGVAGYRLDENAKLIPSEAHAQTLQALRDAVSKRPAPAETLSAQIVAWFLADRWNRTISPFSKTTVARFVDEQLAADARDEAQRVYPGHPALRPGTVMTGDKQ